MTNSKWAWKAAVFWHACIIPWTAAAIPQDGLVQVPIGEVDLARDNSKTLPDIREAYENFMTRPPLVGSQAPDFRLTNLKGQPVTLHDFRGKRPVLLVFGSASCYVYRRNAMKRTDELRRKFQSAAAAGKLEVLVIYTVEAHPAVDPSPYTGFQWTTQANVEDRVLVRQPKVSQERRRNAQALASGYGLNPAEILVDDMDNSTWRAYGEMPNGLYLIRKDGSIAYKEVWAHLTPDRPGSEPPAVAAITALLRRSGVAR